MQAYMYICRQGSWDKHYVCKPSLCAGITVPTPLNYIFLGFKVQYYMYLNSNKSVNAENIVY
jgi:hypothetical protein